MIRNNKKFNFDLKDFLSKKNLNIHKKFLRMDRLNFLKNLILKKKRLRVLEFGTGISTLVIAKSLSLNKSIFYNKIKDFREENFIMYSIDNNKKFLNISKKNIEIKPPETNIWISDYEKELTKKIYSKYKNNRLLTIGIGANFEGKIWDTSNYLELANILNNFFDVIILVGDKRDAILSKQFSLNYKGKIIDCCGHYNLLETAAIIKESDFFVGNDSGLGHIASAVRTKSFTIFGIGEPHRYSPWSDDSLWMQDESHEINNISPKTVAKKIINQIK